MVTFLAFFLTPLGRIAGAVLGVILAVMVFASNQRNIGAAKAVEKIEKATNHAIQKADRAGDKSASGGGVLNKYYRD